MFVIRPLASEEWSAYRAIRLRALQDSPDAFGSTYEAEAFIPDEQWAKRLKAIEISGRDQALVAETAKGLCGLVWCKISADEPTNASLYRMWVAPEARGIGVGRALLVEALNWASAAGVRRVELGVTIADSPAWRLYASHGFVPVGVPEPLREGSSVQAQAMEWTHRDA